MGFASLLSEKKNRLLIAGGVLVILSSVALMNLESPPRRTSSSDAALITRLSNPESAPAAGLTPPASVTPPAGLTPATAPSPRDLELSLTASGLIIPVAGISAEKLVDNYSASRSEGRSHNAIDIMAPQGTPVVAATDGTVVKMRDSNKGGITLYQLDAAGQFVYYYAHLMSYAAGITEGKQVKRGEVIGYVGDTGNATPGSYHLHFGISKPDSPGKWYGGTPVNPFPVLTGR